MKTEFVELRTTDNTVVYVRKDAISALEVVPASQRVEGHVKLFTGGFKFLIAMEIGELMAKLE